MCAFPGSFYCRKSLLLDFHSVVADCTHVTVTHTTVYTRIRNAYGSVHTYT